MTLQMNITEPEPIMFYSVIALNLKIWETTYVLVLLQKQI